MTDARKRAEEALARWDALPSGDVDDLAAWDVARDGMERFRALLASEPETKHPGHDRIAELESLLRECNAVCLCGCPDSEHESYGEDGESCGHDDHECLRVAPAVLEIVQRYRVALSDALAQKPAGAEVREAAERLDLIGEAWSCGDTDAKEMYRCGRRLLAALRATASHAPGSERVSEAAFAQFGRALLPLWWDDGNPGDIDGSAAQDAAEASGLWRRVERHADGVECEWCNNEEPCGELTDTGLAALRGGQKGEVG